MEQQTVAFSDGASASLISFIHLISNIWHGWFRYIWLKDIKAAGVLSGRLSPGRIFSIFWSHFSSTCNTALTCILLNHLKSFLNHVLHLVPHFMSLFYVYHCGWNYWENYCGCGNDCLVHQQLREGRLWVSDCEKVSDMAENLVGKFVNSKHLFNLVFEGCSCICACGCIFEQRGC